MKKTFVAAFLALLTTALFGATPAGGEAALRLRTAGRLLGHAMTNQIGEHQVVVCEEEAYEIQKAVLGAGSPEVVQTLRQMLRHNWNSLDRIRSKELVKRLREQAKLEGPEIALDAAEHARQTALNGDDTEAVEAADKELKEQEEALRASLSPEMQKLWKEGEALDKQLEPFLKGYTNSPAFIEARDDQLKQTLAAAVAANDYLEKNGYTAEHLLEQQRLQGATPETLAALESQFKLQAKHRNEGVEVMKKWASTSGKIDEAQMAEEIAEGNKRLQREMMELAAKDSEALKGYKPFEENGQKRGNLAKAAAQAVEKKGGKVPTNPAAGNSGDDQKPERWFDDGWKLLNESYERGQPLSQLLLLRENLNGLHSVPQRVADEPAWLVKAVLNSQSRVFELEDRLMTALGDCN